MIGEIILDAICGTWERITGGDKTHPIYFKQANGLLKGGPIPTDGKPVADLVVCRDDVNKVVISCWHIPWGRRLRVMLTGNVWLCAQGKTHAPLWIETQGFRRVKKNSNHDIKG